jgi:hypothetical protein
VTPAEPPFDEAAFGDALRAADPIRYHGISEPVARLLFALARDVPAEQAIVEIGSCAGYSTVFLARGAAIGGGATVHCLDPWGLPASSAYSEEAYAAGLRVGEDTWREFQANVARAGLGGSVVAHRAHAHRYSRRWPRALAIGLLYVDGDHSEWGAYADWHLWRPHLADGAAVVFHDYGLASVERAVRRIEPGVMREARVVGTGYRGQEALAFRYRRGARVAWRARAAYWELAAGNALSRTPPARALGSLRRRLRSLRGPAGPTP